MGTYFDENGDPEGAAEGGGEVETESDGLRAEADAFDVYAASVRALVTVPAEELAAQAEIIAHSMDQLSAQLRAQAVTLDRETIAALRRRK